MHSSPPTQQVASLETLAESGTNVPTKSSGDTSGKHQPAATKHNDDPRGASRGQARPPQPPVTPVEGGPGTSLSKGVTAVSATEDLKPRSGSNISVSETVAAVQAAARRGSAEAAAEAANAAIAAAVAVQAAVAAAGGGEGEATDAAAGTGARPGSGGAAADRSAFWSSLETLGSLTGKVNFRSTRDSIVGRRTQA